MIVWNNNFIPFGNYKAFNFYGIILFTKSELNDRVMNHEKIHSMQIAEFMMIAVPITILLIWIFGISAWWFIASLSSFYIWYGLEYLIIRIFNLKDKQSNCYHEISFEEEAYNNDDNLDYLKNRKPFSWTKYISINSYEKK